MKKNKKQRKSHPQTPDDLLIEQIREAFDVIAKPGKMPASFEMPADTIVVETFAETCDILDLLRFEDTHDLLGALMIEALTLPSGDDLNSGLWDICDYLRDHAPSQNPTETYAETQATVIRAWLRRMSQRVDLPIDWDIEQLSPLWHLNEENDLP